MGGDAHDPRDQVGVDPTGPAVADAEPAHPVWGYPFPGAGHPDLDHAIQAATDALDKGWVIEGELHRQHVARVAVGAAAPVLLQATRDRLADLEVLRRLLQDVVDKATPFGELDEPGGPYVMHYLLPTGPIHRALAYLRDGAIPALDGHAAQEEGG